MHKTEVPGVYKKSRGVLVNKDTEALEKYRKKRELRKQKDLKINTLEDKVNSLTQDMEEIKTLLRALAENK